MNIEELFVEKYRLLETENRQLKEAEDGYLKQIAELKAEIAKMRSERENIAKAIANGMGLEIEEANDGERFYIYGHNFIWSDEPNFDLIRHFLGLKWKEEIETRPQINEEGETR